MWKQPDESLIGQCEHNITQGFLLVSLYDIQRLFLTNLQYYQKVCISFISIHQQCMLFSIGIDHALLKDI